jgi:hypothetical protein
MVLFIEEDFTIPNFQEKVNLILNPELLTKVTGKEVNLKA